MFKDRTLKVTEVGEITTLSVNRSHYRYRHVEAAHICKSPRALQVGDVVVVDREPTLNKDIMVRLALPSPCGDECRYFLHDLLPKLPD